MINILCNRLHGIFINYSYFHVMVLRSTVTVISSPVTSSLNHRFHEFPVARLNSSIHGSQPYQVCLSSLFFTYINKIEIFPSRRLILAGINPIAHLAHHSKKGVAILAEACREYC